MTTNESNPLPFELDLLLIQKVVPIISGKWRLAIILLLGEQTLRFGQLSEQLSLISDKVLVSELKALVILKVITRQIHAEIPPKVEYTLTKQGLLALPMLRQIQPIGQLFT